MEKFKNFKDIDFANDGQFIDWVINPDEKKDLYWQKVIGAFPNLAERINMGRKIVLGFNPNEKPIQKETIDKMWHKLASSREKKKYYFSYAAAILFIALLIGGGLIFQKNQKNESYLAFEENVSEQSRLYSNNQSPIVFDDPTVVLDYSSNEGIIINNDSIIKVSQSETQKANLMEKVVVPFGKRICLTLSDKTQVWINSGSQLVFPKRFKKSKREVFLVGEAFFKVTHNDNQEFLVHTANSSIKVLGTEFNVKAYNNDPREEAVLVSGSVSLSKKDFWGKPALLKPGQMGTLYKRDNSVKIKEVDVNLYTSWIEGYIYFKNETAVEVMRQISRYYNKEIIVDRDAGNVSFSGKLDLTQDFDVVLSRISKTSSLRHFYKDGQIIIKQ